MTKRFLFLFFWWLATSLIGVAQSQARYQSDCHDFALYSLKVRSQESAALTGMLPIQVTLVAHRAVSFADTLSGRVEAPGMQLSVGAPGQTQYGAPGDSSLLTAVLHYNPASLPYAPVRFSITGRPTTTAAGAHDPVTVDGYVYFTPYGTVEVWNIADFHGLRRKWITTTDPTAQRRIIARTAIPVSDIPADYVAAPNEEFREISMPGLSYTVPMLWPDSTQWLNDSTARRDGCGPLWKMFKGRIQNVRLFTWHTPDVWSGSASPVKIWLKGVEVQIKERHNAYTEHIMTVYTDNEGYLTQNGSRVFDFQQCGGIRKSHIRIYLKVLMRDQSNRLWVKDERNFQGYNDWHTHDVNLYYNSPWQVLQWSGNNELDVPYDQGGKVFTWAKWVWDYTNASLGTNYQFARGDLVVRLQHGDPGVSSFTPDWANGPLAPSVIHLREVGINREGSLIHEFGHFVMCSLQGWNLLNLPGTLLNSKHSNSYKNRNPNLTLSEGFATGFSMIMDEMTYAVLDQESGVSGSNGSYVGEHHPRVEIIDNNDYSLTHPYVAEKVLAASMLDMWDGPNNYAAFGNPKPLTSYFDLNNDHIELSFNHILRAVFDGYYPQDLVQYYSSLQAIANLDCAARVQLRDVWHYNFSNVAPNFNARDFQLLNTRVAIG